MTELTKEEQAAIRTLQRLAKSWPEGLWVFADGNTLTVLKTGGDGERVTDSNGSFDQSMVVASIEIPNDGGGW